MATMTVNDLLPKVEMFAYYQDHWDFFIDDQLLSPKSIIEGVPYVMDVPQREVIQAVNHNKRTTCVTSKGLGKCQWEEDEIMLADGSYVRCGDLIGKEFQVLSRNDDGTHSVKTARAFDNGIKKVYGVTTDSGEELYRTGNHPLLTFDGWKQIDNLSSGDLIVAPLAIDHKSTKKMSQIDLKLLAYIIGDGGCSDTGVSFSQEDNPQLAEFLKLCDKKGYSYTKESKYDYRIRDIYKLLRNHGVYGKNSFTKSIPNKIFSIDTRLQAIFLNRLYSTDGWAHTSKRHSEIGYCTVSYKLARGVKRLLKRQGIISKLRKKKTTWTYKGIKKRGTAYCVDIHGCEDVINFCERVGIYGKEEAISEARLATLGRMVKRNSNKFRVFPKEAKAYLCEEIEKVGFSAKYKFNIDRSNKIGITYRTVERVNDVIDNEKFNSFLSNTYFDKIEDIQYMGECSTVGIEVDDNHNYITDVYEHNTALASWLDLTFMTLYSYPKVAISAPAGSQLDSALWPEINKWLRNSNLEDLFEHTRDTVKYNADPTSEWKTYRKTPKDETCAQGLHAPDMLIIVDEASGVKEESLQAFDGTLTDESRKNNKILLIGNGNRPDGFFFETHNKKGTMEYWKKLTYNAFQSKFRNDEQINYIRSRYGEDHPRYLIEVMGKFPDANAKSFISYADVMEAAGRWLPYKKYCDLYGVPEGPVELGLDCAGDGDDLNVVIARKGNYTFKPASLKYAKPKDVHKMVVSYAQDIRSITGYDDNIKVKIDMTGGYGSGPYEHISDDRTNNFTAVKVNFAWKANNEDEYDSIASEMWDNVRYNMKNIILYSEDEFLLEELYTRKIDTDCTRVKIQPKKEFKKEYKASPDRADAFILAFAEIRPDKKVVREFDKHDHAMVRPVDYIGNEQYGSVWTSKDLHLSCLYAGWDGFKLQIYDEYTSNSPLPHLGMDISRHGDLTKIIGNKSMFNKHSEEDISRKLRKYGIRVRENNRFDELSAIESLGMFIRDKRLVVDPRCHRLIEQIDDWGFGTRRADLESQFGLCLSLCNLVSLVKDKKSYNDSFGVPMQNHSIRPMNQTQFKKPNAGWMAT